MSQCQVKKCFAIFKVKVTVCGHIIVCTVFSTGDPFAAKLSLMGHHHKPDSLLKRLRIALFNVNFITTVQQVNEYLLILYFMRY